MLFTGIPACLHPSTPLSPPCCHALGAVLVLSLRHQHSRPRSCTWPQSRYQQPMAALALERGVPWHSSQAPRQGICWERLVRVHVASVADWVANGSMRTRGACVSPPTSPCGTGISLHACPCVSHHVLLTVHPCPTDQPCVGSPSWGGHARLPPSYNQFLCFTLLQFRLFLAPVPHAPGLGG